MTQHTSEADSGPTVEGEIPPPHPTRQPPIFPLLPPLRPKFHSVIAVNVFAAVQVVRGDGDADTFGDEDGGEAVRAAAAGEGGGAGCETGV